MFDDSESNPGSYSPIRDYALIGDCHCAALVSVKGSIDWLCLPRFDSPSVFGAILDASRGGHFSISPAGKFSAEQYYVEDTNVLQTVFETKSGRLRLTDLMPVAASEDRTRTLFPERHILRVIECLEGEVEVKVAYCPRPDYGRTPPKLKDRSAMGIYCEHGGGLFHLLSDLPLQISPGQTSAKGLQLLRRGERRHLSFVFTRGEPAIIPPLGKPADLMVEKTIDWWKDWSSRCTYTGPFRQKVLRSALVLKLMTYAPSGAVVASPTTSLPEKVGGMRNWDYRYCWLRDASMTLNALYKIGYVEEAEAYLSWLVHSTRLTRPELRGVYDVFGETHLKEQELEHLEGYAASRPVRIGNEATEQLQLDIYGEAVNGVFEFTQWGRKVDHATAALLLG